MSTFADKVISFYSGLDFTGILPQGVSVLNPYRSNPKILDIVRLFYKKYYDDNKERHFIIGINPGRFGAGVTGVMFTDTKRLNEICGIKISGIETRELSSEFFYKMIEQYGGAEKFYSDFYVGAVSPLGFTVARHDGRIINCNYYDFDELKNSLNDFVVESLKKQLSFGINNHVCFCLGTGKNFSFLQELNKTYGFFGKIIPLEHPRFIMQYRRKQVDFFIEKYISAFTESGKRIT